MKRTIGIPPPTVFFVPIFKKKRGENYEIQNNLEKVRNLKTVHWKAELDGKVCAEKA